MNDVGLWGGGQSRPPVPNHIEDKQQKHPKFTSSNYQNVVLSEASEPEASEPWFLTFGWRSEN